MPVPKRPTLAPRPTSPSRTATHSARSAPRLLKVLPQLLRTPRPVLEPLTTRTAVRLLLVMPMQMPMSVDRLPRAEKLSRAARPAMLRITKTMRMRALLLTAREARTRGQAR